jgi:hypothetical protein
MSGRPVLSGTKRYAHIQSRELASMRPKAEDVKDTSPRAPVTVDPLAREAASVVPHTPATGPTRGVAFAHTTTAPATPTVAEIKATKIAPAEDKHKVKTMTQADDMFSLIQMSNAQNLSDDSDDDSD